MRFIKSLHILVIKYKTTTLVFGIPDKIAKLKLKDYTDDGLLVVDTNIGEEYIPILDLHLTNTDISNIKSMLKQKGLEIYEE